MSGSESTRSQMESLRTSLLSLESARTGSKSKSECYENKANRMQDMPPISFVSVPRLGRSSSLARPPPVMFPCKLMYTSLPNFH